MSDNKFIKNVSELKEQAAKAGHDAKKTISKLKGVVEVGIQTSKAASKAAIDKAGETLNKQSISDGIEKASTGIGFVAKGARAVANSMEIASNKMRQVSDKLKKDKG